MFAIDVGPGIKIFNMLRAFLTYFFQSQSVLCLRLILCQNKNLQTQVMCLLSNSQLQEPAVQWGFQFAKESEL